MKNSHSNRRASRGGVSLAQLSAVIIACALAAFVAGCTADSASKNNNIYQGYSAGAGQNPQNVQTNSTLPGPRYYDSSNNPYHQN